MSYSMVKAHEGRYDVIDDEDGERVASVGKFMPGPMVSYTGPKIVPPLLGLAMARAISRLSNDLVTDKARNDERRRRLAAVLERHPCPDSPEMADVPTSAIAGEEPITRYAPVVKHDGDGDYAIGLHDDLDTALSFLACDFPEWEPHALYDLDTGASVPLNVTTNVTVSDDPTTSLEGDLP